MEGRLGWLHSRRSQAIGLLALLALLAPPSARAEGAVLSVVSPYSLSETVANLKRSIAAGNFRFVREAPWHGGLLRTGAGAAHTLYFCNFTLAQRVIAQDRRFIQFLPCRMVVSEHRGRVLIQAVDPLYVSHMLRSHRTRADCARVRDAYLSLMEEATL